ncbi:MAG: hypothetical protein QM627_02810 [Luteolibacter sp.]
MPKPSASSQDAIEVEVVEIDGVAPSSSRMPEEENTRAESRSEWGQWQTWSGKVKTLDARWWPLWVVLGIFALFLILTVGVVMGALFLVVRLIRGLLLGIFSLFGPVRTRGLKTGS